MPIIKYIYLFIIGAFVGSFLNLISDRLPKGKKIAFGRSECEFCHKPLGVKNLIPIFSFIFQKGKCSFCNKKLSYYYPFSEIFTGSVFMLAGYLSGFISESGIYNIIYLIYFLIIFSFFVAMFLTDIKYFLILDVLVIPAIVFSILFSLFVRGLDIYNLYKQLLNDELGVYLIRTGYINDQIFYSLKDYGFTFLTAVSIALFFLFLIFITKGRGMGFGDVKLGFLIGLVNGLPLGIIAIFLGFVIGAVYSLILIIFKKKTIKDTIAFGPFLILGSLSSFLFGGPLWIFYTQLENLGPALGIGL